MDSLFWEIMFWTLIGSVFSLTGGVIIALKNKRISHRQTLIITSFAAGVILATAFLDLIPESIKLAGEYLAVWSLLGLILMFVMEKLVVWHHHHDDCDNCEHKKKGNIPLLLNFGDTIHNFIDGVAIAATFLVSPSLGVVTSLAVAAHEIPHEMADFGVMLSYGWSKRKTILMNLISSLASILGALAVYFGRGWIEPVVPYLLAISAGMFIYLAGSDLIPELHHMHEKNEGVGDVWQVVIMIIGVVVVGGLISFLE